MLATFRDRAASARQLTSRRAARSACAVAQRRAHSTAAAPRRTRTVSNAVVGYQGNTYSLGTGAPPAADSAPAPAASPVDPFPSVLSIHLARTKQPDGRFALPPFDDIGIVDEEHDASLQLTLDLVDPDDEPHPCLLHAADPPPDSPPPAHFTRYWPNPDTCAVVRELLGPDALAQLQRGRAMVLLLSAAHVSRTVADVLHGTGISRATLAKAACKQPALLLWGWPRLEAQLQAVRQLLQLPASCTEAEVLQRYSMLLSYQPSHLALKLDQLRDLLGLTQVQARQLVARQPMLLRYRITSLRQQCQQLQAAGLPRSFLPAAAASAPAVLTLSPANVVAKLDLFCQLFQVDKRSAVQLAVRSPSLLTMSEACLHGRVAGLAAALQLPPSKLRRVMANCPSLLGMCPETLSSKVGLIAEVLGVEREGAVKAVQHQPSLLGLRAATLHSKINALAELLGVSEKEARALCVLMPALISQSPATLARKAVALTESLQLSATDLFLLVKACPSLLAHKPSTHVDKVKTLSRMLALPLATVVAMVRRQPRALTTRPERLAARWHLISAMAACYPPWARQLSALSMSSRASLALCSEAKLARLHFLLSHVLPQAGACAALTACAAAAAGPRPGSERGGVGAVGMQAPAECIALAAGQQGCGSSRDAEVAAVDQQQQQQQQQNLAGVHAASRITAGAVTGLKSRGRTSRSRSDPPEGCAHTAAQCTATGGASEWSTGSTVMALSSALSCTTSAFSTKWPAHADWLAVHQTEVEGLALFRRYLGSGTRELDWAYGPTVSAASPNSQRSS